MQTNDHKTRDYSAVLEAQYGAHGTLERAKFDEEAYAFYTSQILLEIRKEAKVTQTELAHRIGADKSYISRIEKGITVPSVATFYRIAAALGLSVELNRQVDGLETTERYRDLWFFSYLCNGINFGDMLNLKYSNIVGDEICFFRQKTLKTSKVKKEIQAMITPEMQIIIDKWGNCDKKPNSYIFPYLTGYENLTKKKNVIHDVIKRTNKRLKEIGKAVGIEGLTTYAARHSYATVLKRSGANIAFISESLGHSDLKTTENYLASFEKEERKKNAALLTKFE